MSQRFRIFFILLIELPLCPVRALAQRAPLVRLVQTISLEGVEGRLDHLSIDLKRERLFVAALGNNTVEVVDLRLGKRIRTLTGLREPQDVLFIPEQDMLAVTSRDDGACELLDGESFELRQRIFLGADADNLRYDPHEEVLYAGYGHGALGVINVRTGNLVSRIFLSGHPESFQLERSGTRAFVNLPDAKQVAVIDRAHQAIVTTWPLTKATDNFPMALDEEHRRLFIGVRSPAKLLVFDIDSGVPVAIIGSIEDADDIFYDAQQDCIYVSGGAGLLQVIEQLDVDAYQTLATFATAPGARTSLFVPELRRLFLAVPHRGDQEAEIRVYAVQS